uniref:Chemokine (C-C motif) ligand 14 n=1 Tax=Haemonchus contortus TaxID=6289 RepID=A0A7I4Y2V6_HAECO
MNALSLSIRFLVTIVCMLLSVEATWNTRPLSPGAPGPAGKK